MNEEFQKRLDEIQSQVEKLAAAVSNSELDENSDTEKQDAVFEIVGDNIADISWDNYLHYTTFFDTLDSTEDSGASVSANRLFMSASGTSTVDYVRFRRVYQNIFSFELPSRFRTAFDVGSSSLTTGDPMQDIEAYIGTGSTGTGSSHIFGNGLADNSHYGFYVLGSGLYGITSNGTNYTTTYLGDVNVYDLFYVEAVHLPRERVDFYVSEAVSAITNTEVKQATYRGSITDTLPTGIRKAVYEFSVKNSDGASGSKDLDVGFLELLQLR